MQKKILLYLKCFYQEIRVRWGLWYTSFRVMPEIVQKELVKNKLLERNYQWQRTAVTKVFAVLSVTNWETELLSSLENLGELHHFGWPGVKDFFQDKNDWESFYDKLNQDLQKAFSAIYDETSNFIIFIYASDFSINPATIQFFRKPNTLLISFCWDDLLYFKGRVKGQPVGISELAKQVDINLTLSPEAISRYNYQAAPCFFWDAIPLNKVVPGPLPHLERAPFYVLFIGSKYGWRESFVTQLAKKGIPVICYGNGWPNGSLSDEKMKQEIYKAPVTLGFANVGYTRNITTIKGRDFEIPLYGGLYLTQFSKGLERYYEPGKELYTYHNIHDCVNTIAYIKNNPSLAEEVRYNGYRKAFIHSTWKSRIIFLNRLINEVVTYSA